MFYSYVQVVARIREAIEYSTDPVKRLLSEVDIAADRWSRKMRPNKHDPHNGGTGNTFSFEELSRIAAYFNAPRGWPFIDWDLAISLERANDTVAKATEILKGFGPVASEFTKALDRVIAQGVTPPKQE